MDDKWQELQHELLDLFDRYNLNVAVGLTRDGVAILSQDTHVDALNLPSIRVLDK